MSDEVLSSRDIWETQSISIGERWQWLVGPLQLWVQREEGEWRISYLRDADPFTPRGQVSRCEPGEEPPEDAAVHRYGAFGESPEFRLLPVLPDPGEEALPRIACRGGRSGHCRRREPFLLKGIPPDPDVECEAHGPAHGQQ